MSEPISREALMKTIENLTVSNQELLTENDKLRGLLAAGQGDCVYCGLPAADIAKCPHGFPGCTRMDDIVNAPESEKDRKWQEVVIEEQEDFFASQDAVTGLFSGTVTYNGVPNAFTKPLTLDMLIKMKEDFDKQFPEPLKYKNGVDMSGETFHALGASLGFPTMLSENGGQSWIDPHFNPIIGIEIHIVPSLPFGAVEECRCKIRAFRKDFIEGMEAVQRLMKDDTQ